MEDRRYCTICGRHLGADIQSVQTFQDGNATYTFTYYSASFTEPACLGHGTALTVQHCKGTDAPSWEELTSKYKRIAVPQAFQDAFSDEELQP